MSAASRSIAVLAILWPACGSPGGGSNLDAIPGNDADASAEVIGQSCAVNADCPDAVCDRASQRCVACRVAADCGGGETCFNGGCTVATACESDLDCTGSGQVCGPDGDCVRCTAAADCGPGKGCVQGACTVAHACDSSLDCAATRQVCGPVADGWPEGTTRACIDCASDADCGEGDRCDGGLCIAVCRASGAVCGEIALPDGGTVACGGCVGYCSAEQRVCAAASPIDFALSPIAYVDGADHFYGVDANELERVLVGDKRTNTVTTLFELPVEVAPSPADERVNVVVALDIAPDDPGTLYALTDHRTLWRVPLADPAARTKVIEPVSDIESCFWLDVVGSLYAGGCVTNTFFGSLDGGVVGKNDDVTYSGAIVGERMFATQSATINEVTRTGETTVVYTTALAIQGLVAHDGWLYFAISEAQPSAVVLHRIRVPEGGGALGEAERLGGKLARIVRVSPVGFFGRVCDGACNYALIDPVTLSPRLLGDGDDWGLPTRMPAGIYRDAAGVLRMVVGREILAFPY